MEGKKVYPNWLFTVLKNEYEDDDYWYDIKTDDPVFKEAALKLRGLNRKYADYNKWKAACNIYDTYIDVIIEFNGGEYAVKSMINAGITPDGWTPRPKLKKNKRNKEIENTGILPSKINMSPENIARINEIAMKENPTTTEFNDSIRNKALKPKGEIKRAINASMESTEERRRVSNMYKDVGYVDILAKYFRTIDNPEDERDVPNFVDMLDTVAAEMVEADHEDGWQNIEPEGSRHASFCNNSIRTWDDSNNIRIAKEIYENNGIVTFDLDQMSKDKAKLYRSEFGMAFDKKGLKKSRKMYEKYEKERKRKANSERDLARALTRDHSAVDYFDNTFTLNDYRDKYRK